MKEAMDEQVVVRRRDEFVKASHDPELVRRLTATGTAIRTSTPDEMRTLMVAESANVEAMVQRLGLRQQ